jgi:hypothetical protein
LRELRVAGTGETNEGDAAIRDLCSCSLASYPGEGTTVGGAARAGVTRPIEPTTVKKADFAKNALMPVMISSRLRPRCGTR